MKTVFISRPSSTMKTVNELPVDSNLSFILHKAGISLTKDEQAFLNDAQITDSMQIPNGSLITITPKSDGNSC